ncbi:hypothetical protein F7725_024058 [Dissostichus mawsoni]|uniref:Uncharacterized protein n=1 Tax=Dissostichus mawsoni TaxID=36200 RepID=A0A7J5Y076_DISMA|nr:hypothetical protein F7725_024058 [Dissostichus mawsoni]
MSDNVDVTTTATEPLYLQHCSKGSEASLQPKLTGVNSPSIREASDSLTTIHHLNLVEAVRTAGSSLAKNGRRKAEKDTQRDTGEETLTWQSYLELSLAGLPGLGWIWFGLS